MGTINRWLLGLAAIVGAALLFGCEKPATKPADPSGSASAPGTPGADGDADRQEIERNLADLSADDRAFVDAQKFCPVSGEELGSMGVPVKVEAKGETIFLCCKGCKKEFDADPDKFHAKVNELKEENAGKAKSRDGGVHDAPLRAEPQR